MRRVWVHLFLFFVALTASNFRVNCTDGYYWRDYDGIVPWDAFIAGQDQNGEAVYIGQVLYGATLLPSKIYTNDKKTYYTWGSEFSTADNIKILCTQKPEQLIWVDTVKDGLHLLIDKFLVKGGYEAYYDLYIGRVFHKWQTLVGRIRAGKSVSSYHGLYVSVPEKEIYLDSYQVLTYDPSANSTDEAHCTKETIITKS